MSETAKRSGVQLEALGGRDRVVAFPDELFSHLHFDRQARAWRAPNEIDLETIHVVGQSGAAQMRCA
jgi:hypothetical protein